LDRGFGEGRQVRGKGMEAGRDRGFEFKGRHDGPHSVAAKRKRGIYPFVRRVRGGQKRGKTFGGEGVRTRSFSLDGRNTGRRSEGGKKSGGLSTLQVLSGRAEVFSGNSIGN